jgi:hypothetical protein
MIEIKIQYDEDGDIMLGLFYNDVLLLSDLIDATTYLDDSKFEAYLVKKFGGINHE